MKTKEKQKHLAYTNERIVQKNTLLPSLFWPTGKWNVLLAINQLTTLQSEKKTTEKIIYWHFSIFILSNVPKYPKNGLILYHEIVIIQSK